MNPERIVVGCCCACCCCWLQGPRPSGLVWNGRQVSQRADDGPMSVVWCGCVEAIQSEGADAWKQSSGNGMRIPSLEGSILMGGWWWAFFI